MRGKILQHAVDVLERLADTGEMRHRFETELLLDLQRHFERPRPGAAAGAVGAGGERRSQLVQARECVQQIRHCLVVLRGEELEGDRGLCGPKNVADFHL